MQPVKTPQKSALFLMLPVAVVVPLAVWFFTSDKPISWLAQRFANEFEQAPDQEVDVQASRLAALGECGWKALVKGLHHPRPVIREASDRTLRRLLESWRDLPSVTSAANASVLAGLLAHDLPVADTQSLHVSGDLAERLLGWPDGGDDVELVYNCEQVLRAARQAGWPAKNLLDAPPEPPQLSTTASSTTVPEPPEHAGAGQPVATSVPPADPDPLEYTASTPKEDPVQFGRIESAPIFAFIPSSSGRVERLEAAETRAEPIVSEPESESPPIEPPDWSRLHVHEVLRFLRDASHSTEAEAELRRRNFDSLNLRVARIAADSDPGRRMKLIHALPQLAGVNSASWLLVLARDESPQVRASAIGMLSTASDPRIGQQLQNLEETEPDPGVRAAIAKARRMQ